MFVESVSQTHAGKILNLVLFSFNWVIVYSQIIRHRRYSLYNMKGCLQDSPRVFAVGGCGLKTLNFWLKIDVYFSGNLSAILEISDLENFGNFCHVMKMLTMLYMNVNLANV